LNGNQVAAGRRSIGKFFPFGFGWGAGVMFRADFYFEALPGDSFFTLLGQRFQAEGFLDETTAFVFQIQHHL